MADRVIQRNDTAARWQSINPVLATGEIGIEIDGAKGYKIGDGKTRWNDLPYPANPTNVVQEVGDNENAVMSQKIVSEKLSELGSEVREVKTNQDGVIRFYNLQNKYYDVHEGQVLESPFALCEEYFFHIGKGTLINIEIPQGFRYILHLFDEPNISNRKDVVSGTDNEYISTREYVIFEFRKVGDGVNVSPDEFHDYSIISSNNIKDNLSKIKLDSEEMSLKVSDINSNIKDLTLEQNGEIKLTNLQNKYYDVYEGKLLDSPFALSDGHFYHIGIGSTLCFELPEGFRYIVHLFDAPELSQRKNVVSGTDKEYVLTREYILLEFRKVGSDTNVSPSEFTPYKIFSKSNMKDDLGKLNSLINPALNNIKQEIESLQFLGYYDDNHFGKVNNEQHITVDFMCSGKGYYYISGLVEHHRTIAKVTAYQTNSVSKDGYIGELKKYANCFYVDSDTYNLISVRIYIGNDGDFPIFVHKGFMPTESVIGYYFEGAFNANSQFSTQFISLKEEDKLIYSDTLLTNLMLVDESLSLTPIINNTNDGLKDAINPIKYYSIPKDKRYVMAIAYFYTSNGVTNIAGKDANMFTDCIAVDDYRVYKNLEKHWVYGKNVLWLGTSIPYGGGRTLNDTVYRHKYVNRACHILGARCLNMAYGGSTVSNIKSSGKWNPTALSYTKEEKLSMYSGWTETDLVHINMSSFDLNILPFLNDEENKADLVVIDHGFNDINQADNSSMFNEDDFEEQWKSMDRETYVGAMSYIINEIRKASIYIRIVIMGHYDKDSVRFKTAQLYNVQKWVADRAGIQFLDLASKTGWSSANHIPNTSDVPRSQKFDLDADGNLSITGMWLYDGMHPHSDNTMKAQDHLCEVVTTLLKEI